MLDYSQEEVAKQEFHTQQLQQAQETEQREAKKTVDAFKTECLSVKANRTTTTTSHVNVKASTFPKQIKR